MEEAMEKKKNTILYVEDDSMNMTVMRYVFKQLPEVCFLECETAEHALQIIAKERPDLIIMDIQLPGMDGYQALKLLKGNPDTRDIPIVAMSSFAFDTDIERGKKAGFVEYVTKPVHIKSFLHLIEKLLTGD
jgi:two-component system cell cycle response regulator DivK